MMMKNHYFLFLNLNLWPFLITFSIFNVFFALMIFLKHSMFFNLSFSFFFSFIFSLIWWMNFSKEVNFFGYMSKNIENSLKFSMLLFISSEIFFFFSFFWSYFHFFLSPELEASFIWPYFSLKSFDPFGVPLLNTFVLLSSGLTITLSHYYIFMSDYSKSFSLSIMTVALGLIFSILQWLEYTNSFFSISDGSFGSSFFLLTGFHGIHVIIGTLYILVNSKNFNESGYYNPSMVSFEMAAWYWHFVDVVWIFLYFNLYYFNI